MTFQPALLALRDNPFPFLTNGPRRVEEFNTTPDLTVAIEQPAPLWMRPHYINRDFYAPLFTWMVDGKTYHYRVPIVLRGDNPDMHAMLEDLLRAYRTTAPKELELA